MSEQPKLFELSDQVHRVHLRAEVRGETFDLFHNLREPSAGEWKEYQRRLKQKFSQASGENVNVTDQSLPADEWLWAKVVIDVEGYAYKGESLVCDGEDWKRRVNIIHKRRVIRELSRVWAPSDEDDEAKNSGTASGD